MAELIGKRKGMAKLFGEGVLRISKGVKQGCEDCAIQVKGMEPPAYDIRGLKGLGLGFMTSSRGACHLRSGFYALDLTGKFWRITGVDRFSPKDKGEQVKLMEDFMTVYDCLGMCKFQRGFFKLEGIIEFLNAVVGSSFTEDDLLLVGERINNLKQLFNLDAGIRREDSYLPKRITTEPIKSGVSKGAVLTEEEMMSMLDDYYEARRWDKEGRPTQWKLSQLDLA
jgi:aldehyde:ferredoxin oxidoreductase